MTTNVASETELVDLVVGRVLDEALRLHPNNEAVVAGQGGPDEVRWTYAQLHAEVEAFARGLMGMGVGPGDRVAVWAPNLPAWLVAEYAVAQVGAVLVTINPSYRRDEAAWILRDAEVGCCLMVRTHRGVDLLDELKAVRPTLPRLEHVVLLDDAEPAAGHHTVRSVTELGRSAISVAELASREGRVAPDDLAQIQYTSGTTGRPKGAMLSHRSLVNNARFTMLRWAVGPGDRWCNPMPLFHTTGSGMMGVGIVLAGATHCLVERFEPGQVLDIVERERCTLVETVPTMLAALLERQRREPREVDSLRIVGCSGAPVPATIVRQVDEEWGARVLVLYGLTESSPTITCLSPADARERAWDSVGRPLPHSEVRIVDTETGAELSSGQPGHLQTRGYATMRGYLNQPEATREVFDGDWLSTGDLAQIDEDGYVAIVGRIKDVIIRGGENLYPAEIEEAVRQHPDVLDVCVVGVPDDFFGEEAAAVVRTRGGAEFTREDLARFLRGRLTHQKIPRYVVTTSEYPQTPSGKIQRFRLRETVLEQIQEGAS